MLKIPKDHKKRHPLRLVVLLGIAVLVFMLVARQFSDIAANIAML